MTKQSICIVGCGDVGQRLVKVLDKDRSIIAVNRSEATTEKCHALGASTQIIDLDKSGNDYGRWHQSTLVYLVPPRKSHDVDKRSRQLLATLQQQGVIPQQLILISTTGVYGDHGGRWVDETSQTLAQSSAAKRRLDMETVWRQWCNKKGVCMTLLRVPGIYARSRLSLERLQRITVLPNSDSCGYSNRIHADDLARFIARIIETTKKFEIYNVSDGNPVKMSAYLQAARQSVDLPRVAEVSWQRAKKDISTELQSYMRESKRVSNQKMLSLPFKLKYPHFTQGLKCG